MLQKNGTAVDAAIATLICEGVMALQSMGIGGGFLMTIYNRENETAEVLNARETAPAAAYEDMYKENPVLSEIGIKKFALCAVFQKLKNILFYRRFVSRSSRRIARLR